MADIPVPYSDIEDAVENILTSNADALGAPRIFVEEEPQFGMADAGKTILVYLDRRDGPAGKQTMSAGRRTTYDLRFTLAVACFNMESFREATRGRNEVLGKLELLMMRNRTLSGKVETCWLEGGELYSVRAPAPTGEVFCAIAELSLVAQVSAVNVS